MEKFTGSLQTKLAVWSCVNQKEAFDSDLYDNIQDLPPI